MALSNKEYWTNQENLVMNTVFFLMNSVLSKQIIGLPAALKNSIHKPN